MKKETLEFECDGIGKLRINISGNQFATLRFFPSEEAVKMIVSKAFLASPSGETEKSSTNSNETG